MILTISKINISILFKYFDISVLPQFGVKALHLSQIILGNFTHTYFPLGGIISKRQDCGRRFFIVSKQLQTNRPCRDRSRGQLFYFADWWIELFDGCTIGDIYFIVSLHIAIDGMRIFGEEPIVDGTMHGVLVISDNLFFGSQDDQLPIIGFDYYFFRSQWFPGQYGACFLIQVPEQTQLRVVEDILWLSRWFRIAGGCVEWGET